MIKIHSNLLTIHLSPLPLSPYLCKQVPRRLHLRPPGPPPSSEPLSRDGFSSPPPPSSRNLGSIRTPLHLAELPGGEGGGEEAGKAVELGGLDARRPDAGVLVAEEDVAVVELDGANELLGSPGNQAWRTRTPGRCCCSRSSRRRRHRSGSLRRRRGR